MKSLTLVRHGETTGQSSIRYYGSTDVPLSDEGRLQMRRVGTALAGHRFDAVFTSRLSRSIDAAKLIAGNEVAAVPVPGFDEVHFGRWEGWTREEIAARDPENFRIWQASGDDFRYPEGESRRDFHNRVADALRSLLAQAPAAHGLFVVHRGVIAVMLTELLRLSSTERAALAIDLGSIHLLCETASGWRAEALNRVAHLEESSL